MHMTTSDIREYFKTQLKKENFTADRTGAHTIELLGASFVADEDSIFGTPNYEYISAEIEWYKSQSTNIKTLSDIYGSEPTAWKYSANGHGEINSNYGKLVFSELYHEQYRHTLQELIQNPDSRRAQMVYNRPSIWVEHCENDKNDFICTNAQTVYIRDNKLHMVSQMRSNDAIYGYKNDYAWAKFLMDRLVVDYNFYADDAIQVGNLYWQVMNLHIYSKHFHLVK